jgi:hypothetical protein
MLDGAAVAAAGEWWLEPLGAWLGCLDAAKLIPPTADLVDPRAGERISEHVLLPARGLLFLVLVKKLGPQRVKAVWAGAELDLAAVENDFRAALKAARKEAQPVLDRSKDERRKVVGGRTRNGVALLDETGELRSSYVSRAVEGCLERLRAIGAGPNAISLSVFGAAEDPCAPLVTLTPRAVFGSASDVALANAAAAVRKQRLRLLLSLEHMSSPSGTWADGNQLARRTAVREFWDRTTRIAVHYALVGELVRAEVYSLGANMGEVARTEPWTLGPDEQMIQEKREEWRQLIAKLRPIFRGGLTYSARFPAEAVMVSFWEELDFVGLHLFPRVSAEASPADEDIERVVRLELTQAVGLGIQWNRPVLLLEAGFPSRAESWETPWIPRGPLDHAEQLRYFTVLSDVLTAGFDGAEMLAGIYLWNWHVDPLVGGAEDDGFTLQGKPVESVLPRFFAR